MEAKDTVVRKKCHCEQLYKECRCSCDACTQAKIINKEREAQAEISFKAGEQEADFEWRTKKVPKIMEQFKKAGRKEVVDWVNKEDIIDDYCLEDWQAQLKEWDIEEEK